MGRCAWDGALVKANAMWLSCWNRLPGRLFLLPVFLGVFLFSTPLSAQPREALQKLLATDGLTHAGIGISVKRVSDGQTVCEHAPGVSLIPASVAKLFPTFFALQQRGKDYTYQTSLAYSGELSEGVLTGNLILKAGGDPTLESSYFSRRSFLQEVIGAIKRVGIDRVLGSIEVREEGTSPFIPGSWPWEDVANYYGALYHSFNYRDNLYTLTFQGEISGKAATLLSIVPELPGVEFDNRVITDRKGKNDVWIYGGPSASRLQVRGTVTGTPMLYKVKGAMHHPAAVFKEELTHLLKAEGVTVEGKSFSGKETATLLAISSPTLEEIVFYTNKRSVNLFSQALGDLIDPLYYEQAIKRSLESIGVSSSGVILKDACGLSPLNAAPARVFTDLLVCAAGQESSAFLNSLLEGDKDGSLLVYSDHPRLGKRLRAKTGSFTGVRSLSGYLTTASGERLAFTILINHYSCSPAKVQEAIRYFLAELSSHH